MMSLKKWRVISGKFDVSHNSKKTTREESSLAPPKFSSLSIFSRVLSYLAGTPKHECLSFWREHSCRKIFHNQLIGIANIVGLQDHPNFGQHLAFELRSALGKSWSSLHHGKWIRHCLRFEDLPNLLSSIEETHTWRMIPWYLEVVEAAQSFPCGGFRNRLEQNKGGLRMSSHSKEPCS